MGGVGGVRSRRRPAEVTLDPAMKAKETKRTQEPVGIVISGMPRTQQPSIFSAYVWGPAPSDDTEPKAA